MNSTSDTAKANFITDHGSIRLRCRRARRGPREAAAETVARAARTASATWALAAPGLPARPGPAAPDGGGCMPGGRTNLVVEPASAAGTVARPTVRSAAALAGGDPVRAPVLWVLASVMRSVLFLRLVGVAGYRHQGHARWEV